MGKDSDDRPGDQRMRALRHELRTPIGQIVGYSELLIEEAQDAGYDTIVPDLEKIAGAAHKLTALVDQLVAETRLRSLGGVRTSAMPAEDTGEHVAPRTTSITDGVQRSGHLLVVDDNPENREVLSRMLEKVGYTVSEAESGQKALEAIDAGAFDLVMLDVVMPGMDGFEVLGRLRQSYDASTLPVVMCTGRDGREDIIEALSHGANDYVTKPIDFPIVLARVDIQIALKNARDEAIRVAEELAKRNDFIRRIFGRYVAEDVVDRLLESPESLNLGGELRVATVLMSDLRGFSALTSRLGPQEVIKLLNRYLGVMTKVVDRHGGTIDELMGDGIIVLFGAPLARSDHARRAIACAIDMQLALIEMNKMNREEKLPELGMGIAVNTGELVVGNIGSERRAKYGVVGTPINAAARMEACAVSGQVLASEASVREAGAAVEVGRTMRLQVKGVTEPIVAHEIRGLGGATPSRLPDEDYAIKALSSPLPAHLYELRDKHRTGPAHEVSITGLGRRAARIQGLSGVTAPADLELRLSQGSDAQVIQAKFTFDADQAGSDALVVFTSVPPELEAMLREVVSGGEVSQG